MTRYVVGAFVAVNLAAFFAMGWDKRRARQGKDRVSEAKLAGFAALGGPVGAWCGMAVFRHKTRKRSFQAKLIVATLIFVAWIWGVWKLFYN